VRHQLARGLAVNPAILPESRCASVAEAHGGGGEEEGLLGSNKEITSWRKYQVISSIHVTTHDIIHSLIFISLGSGITSIDTISDKNTVFCCYIVFSLLFVYISDSLIGT
jgi:hypothetical protein